MAHDVFISYASPNKAAADTICAGLEQRSIRCWMAPRDIVPGVPWAESIIDAIEGSRVMLLLFSEASNKSVQVQREVERAVHKDVPLVPVRIENVMPTRTMEYFISSQHWFDAIQTPLEQHLDRMAQAVKAHLAEEGRRRRPSRSPTHDARPPPAPRLPRAVRLRRPRPRRPRQPVAAPAASEPLIVGNYELTQVLGHRPVRQHRLRRSAPDAREPRGGARLPADGEGQQGSHPRPFSSRGARPPGGASEHHSRPRFRRAGRHDVPRHRPAAGREPRRAGQDRGASCRSRS